MRKVYTHFSWREWLHIDECRRNKEPLYGMPTMHDWIDMSISRTVGAY